MSISLNRVDPNNNNTQVGNANLPQQDREIEGNISEKVSSAGRNKIEVLIQQISAKEHEISEMKDLHGTEMAIHNMVGIHYGFPSIPSPMTLELQAATSDLKKLKEEYFRVEESLKKE